MSEQQRKEKTINTTGYQEVNPSLLLKRMNEIDKLRKSDNPPSKEKLKEMLDYAFNNLNNDDRKRQ